MKKKSKVKFIGILMLTPVPAILFFIYCAKTQPIPDYLIGVWTTSSPKYVECFFEIKKEAVIFGTGMKKYDFGIISKVTSVIQDKRLLYTIHYKNNRKDKLQFSFYYEAADKKIIRFKNQKQIEWTKLLMK